MVAKSWELIPEAFSLTSLGDHSFRRLKRAKEKAQQRAAIAAASEEPKLADESAWGEGAAEAVTSDSASASVGVDRVVAGDELESAVVLRADHRVRSFDFAPTPMKGKSSRGSKDSTRVLVTLHNNSMEVWAVEGVMGTADAKAKKKRVSQGKSVGDGEGIGDEEEAAACSRLATLDLQGHRSDIRAVAISSDGSMVASVSHGLAKAWSSKTRQCVRSVPCGFGLSVAFAPGDRHLLVGTKEGHLQVGYRRLSS